MYVEQPPSFEDEKKPNHVYKLRKALYGLKQAPRAWYERLRDFLLSKVFKMGKIDTTLFTKKLGNNLFVMQIYVDDIIFGSTNQDFCEEFGKIMTSEFEMSVFGELSYFFGLQIKQMKNGTFMSQASISRTCSISLEWMMLKLLVYQSGQVEAWIVMLVATWWIKRCIGL